MMMMIIIIIVIIILRRIIRSLLTNYSQTDVWVYKLVLKQYHYYIIH